MTQSKPFSAFVLEFVWRTDQGRMRQRNEDAIVVRPDWGVVVVADGIGGSTAGHVASRLATETIAERLGRSSDPRSDAERWRLYLQATVEEANIAILRYAKEHSDCSGMGTTVVTGVVGWDWLAFAYVGDSRLYRLHGETLTQLSRDHSFIQKVVDQGFFDTREDARRYGISDNILTRALGSLPSVTVSADTVEIATGDVFLFCTDGLSGMVPDDWLRQILLAAKSETLEVAADALVQLANERGGTDNITLALVRVGECLRNSSATDAPA
ncbi:serine/threonine-protein phosphatase [Caldichromatium japonicum]|uniref:Serine/threonine-protein phosphatase n=1 Tax=Caldichromatium japonicum TaxID=2699430 RepID=A0A6G7VEU4_9GAMM|nr:protein phosphatase 2C domain-containing protein [Caldichromatium japonicum]QIK38420.1 serine/threonine-protein phosphatase [Caldichromatium japonicum]